MKTAFMIAGTTSGAGKTTVTQGILALFIKERYSVQSFKLGPDYIDTGYHAAITGRPCINLDKFLLTPPGKEDKSSEILRSHFYSYSNRADVLVIEAVGGIFDDWYNDGNSPWQIAIDLDIPILLIADGFTYCQTLGLMLNPLLSFKPDLNIAGIILNRVTSEQHSERIIETIDTKYKSKFLGHIPPEEKLFINERHLGLKTKSELSEIDINIKVNEMADFFSKQISIDQLKKLQLKQENIEAPVTLNITDIKCKIAVAKDKAFSFYYVYNMEYLEQHGAELIYFSPIKDKHLPPDIDGIYLGGGFPEVYASELEHNKSLMTEIKMAAENNMPIYAECGGLIYLGRQIKEYETCRTCETIGIFPFNSYVDEKLTLSYVEIDILKDCLIGKEKDKLKGHVFHQSKIEPAAELSKACQITELTNFKKMHEGYIYKNVYASYVHIHFGSCPSAADNFIAKMIE